MEPKQKKKKKAGNIILDIILVIAIGIFLYAAYNLYQIYAEYKAGTDEYDDLRQYTSEATPTPAPDDAAAEEKPKAAPPIDVNFAELQQVNPDIVGWIYVEAIPEISYPIARGTDNDYYLHHTIEGVKNTSASIFMDYNNKADFSDANTIVYGHNMRNQSMFGRLKQMRDQSVYDQSPYFWIMTPNANYRYRIYSATGVPYDDEVYTLFSAGGPEFKQYLEKMKSKSDVTNDAAFTGNEKVVTLSTCTSDDKVRCVVQGVQEEM